MTDHSPLPIPNPNSRVRPDAPRHRKKQSEVTIVGGMREPAPRGLSSGESSPSVISVETASTGLGLGLSFARADGSAPVVNADSPSRRNRSGMGVGAGRRESRASSSSWSRTPSTVASGVSGGEGHGAHVDVDVDGNGNVQTQADDRLYTCLFHMLDCHDSFDDVLHWKTHVLSHFRTHPPPRTARCPLCSSGIFQDEGDEDSLLLSPLSINEGEIEAGSNTSEEASQSSTRTEDHTPAPDSAWMRMLDHVAETHYQQGETLAGSRPDFELMRYLYGRRIISDAQFKAMQLAPAPSSPAYHRSQDGVRASIGSSDEPYCAPYSKRREERMRGATRGVSVV